MKVQERIVHRTDEVGRVVQFDTHQPASGRLDGKRQHPERIKGTAPESAPRTHQHRPLLPQKKIQQR